MNKIALITGATSGIGKACAEKFAVAGFDIIITGRRADRLKEIKKTIEVNSSVRVLPLEFDVQDRTAVTKYLSSLPADWKDIDVLVNNAGLAAGRDLFDEASMDDWENMLNTNVHGLLYVTRAILPFMTKRKKGHIINIGSIAGKEVYERGNVYCATKSAVDTLSQAMRIDLLRHSIKVTAIHPGAVETEFSLVRFKGDEAKAAATYDGLVPLTAVDIADTVFYCANLPAHVCVNDLVITCIQQAGAYYFYKTQ